MPCVYASPQGGCVRCIQTREGFAAFFFKPSHFATQNRQPEKDTAVGHDAGAAVFIGAGCEAVGGEKRPKACHCRAMRSHLATAYIRQAAVKGKLAPRGCFFKTLDAREFQCRFSAGPGESTALISRALAARKIVPAAR